MVRAISLPLGEGSASPRKWSPIIILNGADDATRLLPATQWHYVHTKDNSVDIASRGPMPVDLLANELWWKELK